MSRRKNGRPTPKVDRKVVEFGWYPLPSTPDARNLDVKHPPMSELIQRRPQLRGTS